MKKIRIIILLLIILSSFTGCMFVKDKTKSESYDKSIEILRCFDEKDTEGLRSFFCQHSQDTDSINDEIEAAFEFYEGKSVSFEFAYNGGVAGKWRDGKAVDEHITPEIRSIVTDTDNKYLIFYHEYLTYTADEKCVGVTYMLIFNEETDEKLQIGDFVQ